MELKPPQGFKSWILFMRHCQEIGIDIPEKHDKPVSIQYKFMTKNGIAYENVIVSDIKDGVLNEILPLIPSENDTIDMLKELRFSAAYVTPENYEQMKLPKFLDKIINLYW